MVEIFGLVHQANHEAAVRTLFLPESTLQRILTARGRDTRPWFPLDISYTRKQHRETDLHIRKLPSRGYRIHHQSIRCAYHEPCLQH